MVIADDHIDAKFSGMINGTGSRYADVHRNNNLRTCLVGTVYRKGRKAEPLFESARNMIVSMGTDSAQKVQNHCGARCAVHIVIAMNPYQLFALNGLFDTIYCQFHSIHEPWGM